MSLLKTKVFFSLLVSVGLFLTGLSPLRAGELGNGKKDRAGFLLGFGVGGGWLRYSGAGSVNNRGALLGDLKIGGGVSEKVLLMYVGLLTLRHSAARI